MADKTAPIEVQIAIRVIVNNVKPGFDNCTAVVQAWLDGRLEIVEDDSE